MDELSGNVHSITSKKTASTTKGNTIKSTEALCGEMLVFKYWIP